MHRLIAIAGVVTLALLGCALGAYYISRGDLVRGVVFLTVAVIASGVTLVRGLRSSDTAQRALVGPPALQALGPWYRGLAIAALGFLGVGVAAGVSSDFDAAVLMLVFSIICGATAARIWLGARAIRQIVGRDQRPFDVIFMVRDQGLIGLLRPPLILGRQDERVTVWRAAIAEPVNLAVLARSEVIASAAPASGSPARLSAPDFSIRIAAVPPGGLADLTSSGSAR